VASLIDPSEDFAVVDELETVTYYRRTGNSTFDEGTICDNALRRDVGREEVQLNGASLVRIKTRWHIWAADLGPGPPPKVNDVIQDAAGTRWSVLEVDEGTLQSRYRIQAAQER
jgi:hypothetical protein